MGADKGVGQAIDFLTAIAMSKWSSSHYGAADGNVNNNKLIKQTHLRCSNSRPNNNKHTLASQSLEVER